MIHLIYTFYDDRRALSLLLILRSSGQGDIPSKSINADAEFSQNIVVKEL